MIDFKHAFTLKGLVWMMPEIIFCNTWPNPEWWVHKCNLKLPSNKNYVCKVALRPSVLSKDNWDVLQKSLCMFIVHIYYFKIKDIWVLASKTSCLNLFAGFAGLRKRNKNKTKGWFIVSMRPDPESEPECTSKCDQKLPSNKYVRKVALR